VRLADGAGMTLMDRLRALYTDQSRNIRCDYCDAPTHRHRELCVWKTTQQAIALLEAYRELHADKDPE
jgi:ribosomal protein L37AE/L43A